MGSTEIEFSPFLSLAAIATGACKETIVSDSADLRASHSLLVTTQGFIQEALDDPTP